MRIRRIEYKKRRIGVCALVIATWAALIVFLIFCVLGMPADKKVVKGSFETRSEIKYTPVVTNGIVYNESNIQFGTDYISKFIERLDLNCLYDFDCNSANGVSGKYTVTALLEAKYSEENTVWKKEFLLCPEVEFAGKHAEKNLIVDLREYRSFESSIEAETDLSTNVTMTITYTVDVSAMVGNTPINKKSVSTLVLPLDNSLLRFSGEPVSEINEEIEEVVKSEIKFQGWIFYINLIMLLILLVVLFYVLKFTQGIHIDNRKQQLERFFKRYNDRIVELNKEAVILVNSPIIVKSLKDLLLIADELKKPIIKVDLKDYTDIRLYVLDETRQFVYCVNSQ